MIKINSGNTRNKRKKKYLKKAKGYRGLNSKAPIFAMEQVVQSLNSMYKWRKLKKRYFKSLWIGRINAQIRYLKNRFSSFIGNLRKKSVLLNKKMLANFTIFNSSIIEKLAKLTLISNIN